MTIRENAIIRTVIGKFRVLLGVYIIHITMASSVHILNLLPVFLNDNAKVMCYLVIWLPFLISRVKRFLKI